MSRALLLHCTVLCAVLTHPAVSPPPEAATCEPPGEEAQLDQVCGPAEDELLSDVPLRGLHVLRAVPSPRIPHCGVAACPMFEVEVHVDGMAGVAALKQRLTVLCDSTLENVTAQLKVAVMAARAEPDAPHQLPRDTVARYEADSRDGLDRWAMYSPRGEPVQFAEQLLRCPRTLAFEGGLFVWPGVRVGYSRTVGFNPQFGAITLVTRSLQPLIFLVDPLLSDHECKHVVSIAEPELVASDISQFDDDLEKPATTWRRSKQARLANDRDPIVTQINDRAAAVLNLPKSHLEPLEALLYGISDKLDAHWDYFDRRRYAKQPHMLALTGADGSRNRIATLLWYMNSVSRGGETFFPRAGGLTEPADVTCDGSAGQQGMKVVPTPGKAVLFYSLRPDGAIDPFSLHGSCPVEDGFKWAVNQRVWNEPYHRST
eukprot:COSAG02_NODE_126_length_34895_cov_10.960886_3_plen_430_part_00